jgi:hypothetical protein
MDQTQKTTRDMILDRLSAAQLAMHGLAIEQAGDQVRVTGTVPTVAERERAVAVMQEAQAQGIRATCRIEVRPDPNAQNEESEDPTLRAPAEPA